MAETVENSGSRNDKMSELEKKQRTIDRAPFQNLKISDTKILDTVENRTLCRSCYKSRKFFCYTCCLPVIDEMYIPRVKLPLKIDIIKHRCEVSGKSTAIHATILAPEDVRIYIYPEFPEILDKEKTILIFPSNTTVTVEDLFIKKEGRDDITMNETKTELPIKRAIFIDSTWKQSKEIYRDHRLKELRCVILRSRISQFWRHQKNSPRWYLATIEAIHQFLVELQTCAFGMEKNYADLNNSILNVVQNYVINDEEYSMQCLEIDQRYNGQYDNLLYFFKYMYDKIHSTYDHDKLQAYKRPLL